MAKQPFALSRRQLLEAFAAWPAVTSVPFSRNETLEPPLVAPQLRDLINHQGTVAIAPTLSTFERLVLTSGQRPVEARTELSVYCDDENYVLDLLTSNRSVIRGASGCAFEPIASQSISNGLQFSRRLASPGEVFRTAESVLPRTKLLPSAATVDDLFVQLALDIDRRFPSSIGDYSSPFGRLLVHLERVQLEIVSHESRLVVRAWADDITRIERALKAFGRPQRLQGLVGLVVEAPLKQLIALLDQMA